METKFPRFSELAKSEIITYPFYAIFLRNDNIIQIDIKDNFDCELADSKKMLDAIRQLSRGRKYPLLVIYSDFNSFTKEAKDFVAKSTETTADALVGDGFAFKMVGNIYLRMSKPIRPTKLFNDVESALKWLEQFNE